MLHGKFGEASKTVVIEEFLDGEELSFVLPPPKFPIYLDITGVSVKVANSNKVNDIVLYKAWMKVTIPAINFTQEFDDVSSKIAITGMLQFEDKDELYVDHHYNI